MSRPLIGVMPQYNTEKNDFYVRGGYIRAILETGGMPIMLPPTADETILRHFVGLCEGIIFAGGGDVDPSRYGEERLPECGESVALRDESELLMLKLALEAELPILGICRGEQVVNVGMGGTLFQDVPSQIDATVTHSQEPSDGEPTHTVHIVPDSPLAKILGETAILTNSYHHQAVKDPAPGMEIMARAENGVIEAYYFPEKRFVWGIQWHPEMSLSHDEYSIKIFEEFMKAVKEK